MAKIKGTNFHDVLHGTGGADTLLGLGGDDSLFGNAGNDKLIGGNGDDTMSGGAGNDTFIAGIGFDHFKGGGGTDTVNYAASTLSIGVYLDEAGGGTNGAQHDTFSGIENIIGTRFGDEIEGNGSANVFLGNGGNDHLVGNGGNDRLDGGDGDDQLEGGAGGDALIGGNGFDSVIYEHETAGVVVNLLTGTGGGAAAGDTFSSIERVFGSNFGDVFTGDNNANVFFGEGGSDTINANGGNDTLFGGDGADILNGGDGNDRIDPGSSDGGDFIIGGIGNDWVDYSQADGAVTVLLTGNVSAKAAAGDSYNGVENVNGSAFDDTLQAGLNGRAYGDGGDDLVLDGAGTEVLRGGRGADTLTDLFLGADDGHRDIFCLEAGLGRDKIVGFNQGANADLFWLPNDMFGALAASAAGVLGAGTVIDSTNPAATANHAQLIYETDTHILWYDADGTGAGASVQVALLSGFAGTLSTADFHVVPDV